MPTGSFDIDPATALADAAAQAYVCRWLGDGDPIPLPNVACLQIDWRAGSDPPLARFAYLLDELTAADGYPSSLEEVWPLGANGPYVVQPDDRLLVLAPTPDGGSRLLFDGFAQVPKAEVTPAAEVATFVAVHVSARCFDTPIVGRLQRDASDPEAGAKLATHLPARFNPVDRHGRSVPNCTPVGHDVGEEDRSTAHPVFLDEGLERSPEPRAYWTLSGFARYLLAVENDQRYVTNPDFDLVDRYLKAFEPKKGPTYDPNDANTYTATNIFLRDVNCNNMTWPEALDRQLAAAGFLMTWVSYWKDGRPEATLNVFRSDARSAEAPRVLWLDARRSAIDPARNQVAVLELARDLNACVNAFSIETAPRRVELSVVLAPGFTPQDGDESPGTRPQFYRSNLAQAPADTRRKYRWHVADEAADGHFDDGLGAWVDGAGYALDLTGVFPDDKKGIKTYSVRRRPGSAELIARDSAGRAYRASLSISFDYAGAVPGVWDTTGTWQPVEGGWRLLPDRLGIEVTAEDPENWNAGRHKQEVRGVTWWASPPPEPPCNGRRPALRLTTVIEDDFGLAAYALNRPSSPTKFTRLRRVDGADHYRQEKVHPSSVHFDALKTRGYKPDKLGSLVIRDDTERATAHARALRAANETPPLAGSIVIPFVTDAYRIGDRIKGIKGKGIPFVRNLTASKEAPNYPTVVGVTWNFAGDTQSTTLQLTDLRALVQER